MPPYEPQPALDTARARTAHVMAAVDQLDRAAAVLHEFEAQSCLGLGAREALSVASLAGLPRRAHDAMQQACDREIVRAEHARTTIIAEVDDDGTLAAGVIQADEMMPLLTVAIGGGLLVEMTPAEAAPVVLARQDTARERLRAARISERRIERDIEAAETALGRLIRLSGEDDEADG